MESPETVSRDASGLTQESHGKWSRVVSLGGGAVLIAVGIVALPAPGPGWLVIGLGAGLISRESAMMARALDWLELRLGEVLGWARRTWAAASLPIRLLVGLVGLGLLAGAGVLAYSVIVRG